MTCNRITKPEMTKEQAAECQSCKHASGKKIWCCLFGVDIDKTKRIITPSKRIATKQKPPTILQMAEHFTSAMIRWAKSGLKCVSKIEYIRRRSICSDCAGGWRCPHCGCVIKSKTALATEKCPENKW